MIRHLYKFANGELSPIGDEDDFISNYIKEWNALKDTSKIRLGKAFHFYAVYHSMEDLYSGNDYFFIEDKKKEEDRECDYPVIHLTMFDIFTPPKDSITIPNAKRYKKIIDSSIWNYYVPFFGTEVLDDKNILIEELNYEQFNRTLAEISQNTQNGLYNLQVSHEYSDLFARLLRESHLNGSHEALSPFLFHSENEMRGKIRDYEKDHHLSLDIVRQYRWRFLLLDDKCIRPLSCADGNQTKINKLQIIFNNLHHVLGFDKDKIWFRAFEKNKNGNIIDNEDNILEIKDRGGKKKIGKTIAEEGGKKNFIETEAKVVYGRVIDCKFEKDKDKDEYEFKFVPKCPDKPEDIQILVDCAENIAEAEYCLQTYRYGIVLLDYLLKDEYGYQLLEHLQEWSRNKEKRIKDKQPASACDSIYKPGPNKRFFFMFISAFTTAVHERMLEKGFGRRERRLWIIGDGACPTNTPYLFSYQLMQLMRHRINDLKKGNEGGYLTLIELLNEIFVVKGDNGAEDIRQKAHENFNKLLFMRDKYRQLEQDLSVEDEKKATSGSYIFQMKSSMLVQSVYKYVNHFSGAFFEHLQHLVYLTAYGTIRQWQDMWEEYVFINKELCDYDMLVNRNVTNKERHYISRSRRSRVDNTKEKGEGQVISDAIRDYIINLKENNY